MASTILEVCDLCARHEPANVDAAISIVGLTVCLPACQCPCLVGISNAHYVDNVLNNRPGIRWKVRESDLIMMKYGQLQSERGTVDSSLVELLAEAKKEIWSKLGRTTQSVSAPLAWNQF